MAEPQICFDDGLSYERYMGDWTDRWGVFFSIGWRHPQT